MHEADLILTLTFGLAAALAFGYLTNRLGLSPIVGYLLAGIAVGPHTPGFVADRHLAEQMAEIGVILLMFGVGLHFHVEDLLAVRRVAVPGAVVQSLAATALGTAVGLAFGWSWAAGVVFGLAISVASTVVLLRVLADNNELHTPSGHIAVGWLVVEDLFTVVVLVLLPVLFAPDGGDGGAGLETGRAGGGVGVGWALGVALLKIGVLVGFTLLVGGRVIPRLLEHIAAARSRELFTLTVLVVALGIAVGSARLFGVSMALGAFLAGMVVGRSEFSLRAASDALPMRDAFTVLFFVSVGMLFEPAALPAAPWLVAATLAVILIGKPLAAAAIVLGLGYPVRTALSVSAALSQIGEFSFILASLGRRLGLLGDDATNALVAAAIVSITLNPVLYRLTGPAEAWAARRPRLWTWLTSRARRASPDAAASTRGGGPSGEAADRERDRERDRDRAVVIGYGPVGRMVVRLLRENGIEPTVAEMNLDTVRSLRGRGIRAVYGDAGRRETLEEAGLAGARALILSAAGPGAAGEIIRLAREINPAVRILARSAFVGEVAPLRRAGADGVFSGEGEVALAMTESILRQLGATPEQIDRERDRVRSELSGPAEGEGEADATPRPASPDAADRRPVPPPDVPPVS
jgi:CPA2 family monovalent cation:H+ antiporter-2